MKKKILITILVIIVILLAVGGYFLISDFVQEGKLKTEILEINELSNTEPINIEAINERLERTLTKGDYKVVEQAFKQYLKDSFDNSLQIAEILNDEKITTLLTAENYKEDGKDFTESKEYIATTKAKLEDCKAKYTEFLTEEKAMSYIQDKGLDSYYIDFYKQEFVGDMNAEENDGVVENSIDEIIALLDTSNKVLDLLSKNQNGWKMDGDTIVFNSESLSNEYDNLVNSL